MDLPQLVYPFTSRSTFGFSIFWWLCIYKATIDVNIPVFVETCFHFFWINTWEWVWWVMYGSSLGTGSHSRRWVAGKQAKLHLPLPIACITAWTPLPLTLSVDKLSSMKPVPGAKKVGDCWCMEWMFNSVRHHQTVSQRVVLFCILSV